ncbi:MAG: RagB/SusD family nutrient uptake outer membrane protein [Pedobacter sp.]
MKIKYFIAAFFMVLLISSCEDDFLNLNSPSSLSVPVYFNTQADFVSAVNGIYYEMRGWFNTPNNLIIGDMHSDNARYYYDPLQRFDIYNENVADFVPDNQMFSNNWGPIYKWIARANQVLDLIDKIDFDQTTKDNLKGQALFLRAYSYWWLTRIYGDVCLHLKPVTTKDQASLPLTSQTDVIAQIIDDASMASTLLKNKATQEKGRVTSGTARMLLADVYMWQKEWSSAEAQLMTLTGEYSLMPVYADVTNPTKKNNAESIFEIQFSSQSSTYSSSFLYRMFPKPFGADSLKKFTGITNPVFQPGESILCPTPDLIAAYEPGDKRFTASIRFVHDDYGIRAPMCIKYLHSHSLLNQTDENMPVYRYAEVLLFLAEAINEQGGRLSAALGYLNQVRSRAGLANSTASTQSVLREAIVRERQVELAFEGKRWFDLVRTGKAAEVISAYGARVIANPEKYYFKYGVGPVPSAFTNIVTVFNIPELERLYNPLIN